MLRKRTLTRDIILRAHVDGALEEACLLGLGACSDGRGDELSESSGVVAVQARSAGLRVRGERVAPTGVDVGGQGELGL